MKTVEQILERLEDEIQIELTCKQAAIGRNEFTAASLADCRVLLLEQLHTWIGYEEEPEQESPDAEKRE